MSEKKKQLTILDLGHKAARKFFLCHESYATMDLPKYFNFSRLLQRIDEFLKNKKLRSWKKAGEEKEVNHSMFSNKDGRYGWRRFEFIHPALYVTLVHKMTEKKNWEHIQGSFARFHKRNKVECMSIPLASSSEGNQTQTAYSIQEWWKKMEQRSIELALEYGCVLQTDIANCYDSIYTHSIDWALHGKSTSGHRDLIGGMIDGAIRNMRSRQSNGIPQGSTLTDFIAEMVLGYADTLINEKIRCKRINKIKILRYRDDYRIFATDEAKCDEILKIITEVMATLGMRINSSKTIASHDVIRASIKPDKLAWLEGEWLEKQQKEISMQKRTIFSSIKPDKLAWFGEQQEEISMQKRLLLIHGHADQHPNAGSLLGALNAFYKTLLLVERMPSDVLPMISIVTDIAFRNPKTCKSSLAIISKLIDFLPSRKKKAVCEKIVQKFRKAPNNGHTEVWLHRVVHYHISAEFSEPLTQLASLGGDKSSIWNNDWIDSPDSKELKKSFGGFQIDSRQ